MTESTHLAMLGGAARPAGGPRAADARSYCRTVLGDAGFYNIEIEFDYSNVAGVWATPAAGVIAALAAIGLYLGRRTPWLTVVSASGLIVTFVLLAYVGRRGVLDFPAGRRTGVNLEARRGGEEPRVWLVA
ncbi:MAG: hypothetical protein ABI205_10005, partial [Gemmatimonadaceae bacterium]